MPHVADEGMLQYIIDGYNCHQYPHIGKEEESHLISPAIRGQIPHSHETKRRWNSQTSIQHSLHCHAPHNKAVLETQNLHCHSFPIKDTTKSTPCKLIYDHCTSPLQARPRHEMVVPLAYPQRYQPGVHGPNMAFVSDVSRGQLRWNAQHLQPIVSVPWTAFERQLACPHECEDVKPIISPSRTLASLRPPSYAPSLSDTSIPTPPDNNFNFTDNLFRIQEDDFSQCNPLGLQNRYGYMFNFVESNAHTTSLAPLVDTDSLRACADTTYNASTIERDWLGFAGDDFDYASDFQPVADGTSVVDTGFSTHTTGTTLPSSRMRDSQNADPSSADQHLVPESDENHVWDSFLNVGNQQHYMLNAEETHGGEELALARNPSLPILEHNVVFDSIEVQSQANHLLMDRGGSLTATQEAIDNIVNERNAGPSRQPNRDADVDKKLIEWKRQGLSYKEIKKRGGFRGAESTLRGRYRTLTKHREDRLRKPIWPREAEEALLDAVDCVGGFSCRTGMRGRKHTADKIPWKKVAQWMVSERGCYRYGNATVKKKFQELQEKREQTNI